MPSRSDVVFHDGEIQATLPNAYELTHVDSKFAPWTSGWIGSKVDWLWREANRFYLCELKDPECIGAVANPPPANQLSHTDRTVQKLTGSAFPNEFAKNFDDTVKNLRLNGVGSTCTYVVVAAISPPDFDAALAMTAGNVIERHLKTLGHNVPVAVLNLDFFNRQLAPRSLKRTR